MYSNRRSRLVLWVSLALVGLGALVLMVVGGDDEGSGPSVVPEDLDSTTVASLDPPGDPNRVPLDGFDEIAVAVLPAGTDDWLTWCLLAALEAEQRRRGLMAVTDLRGYAGMAFVYEDDVTNSFHMQGTPTPLSIAWIAATGEVVSTADMEPCADQSGCPSYAPAGPYRSAIEVFQGGLDDLGIGPGAQVVVGGGCAPRH